MERQLERARLPDEEWKVEARRLIDNQFLNLLVEWGWLRNMPETDGEVWTSPRIEDLPVDREWVDPEKKVPSDEPIWYTFLTPVTTKVIEKLAILHWTTPEEIVEETSEQSRLANWRESGYRIGDDREFFEQMDPEKQYEYYAQQ